MLNYNHVYYFHVTAEEGSFAAAAQRLGVTQPTVSEQIRQLERTVGVALFERGPATLRLTTLGRLAYEHTTAMFRTADSLVAALAGARSPPIVALRIGISTAVSRTLAAGFLLPVLELDGCVPTIHSASFDDLVRDLRGNELDLVLGESEPPTAARRGLVVERIYQSRLLAVAGPTVVPDEAWTNVRVIHYRVSSALRWEVDDFLSTRELRPITAAETDDAGLMLEAVASGPFVAFVPHSLAREALASGRVRTLEVIPGQSLGVHAVYHDGQASDLARRAAELLADRAATRFDT